MSKKLIPGQNTIIVREDGSLLIGTSSKYVEIDNLGNIKILTDKQVSFRDSDIYIYSSADGWLNLAADIGVEVNAPILNVASIYSTAGFDCGDAGGFSGLQWNAGATTLDVYIDGAKIGHFATDGTYNDDV